MGGRLKLAILDLAFDAHHEARAAHVLDDERMLVLEARELLLEGNPQTLDAGEKAIGEDDIEHRIADRHGKRIAAESRAMGAGGHAQRRFFGRETSTHREAAADALGNRHDVGGDARPLVGEELAGAPDAALDLIEHQENAVLVAQFAQGSELVWRQRADAALALDRLDENAGRLITDRRPRL